MDNLAIARVLAEIGDLLEIKNENPFKVRAYRNAAASIAHHPERLADLPQSEWLAIAGIGKDLAAKIRELSTSGTCLYHQELLQQFPPTILDLLRLQGVGPKTVALLYGTLNITTVAGITGVTNNNSSAGTGPVTISATGTLSATAAGDKVVSATINGTGVAQTTLTTVLPAGVRRSAVAGSFATAARKD